MPRVPNVMDRDDAARPVYVHVDEAALREADAAQEVVIPDVAIAGARAVYGNRDNAAWRVQYLDIANEVRDHPPAVRAEGGAYPRSGKAPKKQMSDINLDTKIGDAFSPRVVVVPEALITSFKAKHPQLFLPQKTTIDPNVLLGLEVECENILTINPELTLCFWRIDQDGSLRNNGREFKTYPIAAQYALPALTQLFSGLNADIDFSKRTSVHVHVDVRSLTFKQVAALLLTYTAVENLLFKYCGTNRRNSIFCTPITDTNLLYALLSDEKNIFNVNNVWAKYTALNTLPRSTLGTLEFRHFPGSNNIQAIMGWINLILSLRVFVHRYKFEQILPMITSLNSSSAYHDFVEKVFGEYTVFLDTSNLLGDMEHGCTLVKNAGIANPFNKVVASKQTAESSFGEYISSLQKKPKSTKKFVLDRGNMNNDQVEALLLLQRHLYPGVNTFVGILQEAYRQRDELDTHHDREVRLSYRAIRQLFHLLEE